MNEGHRETLPESQILGEHTEVFLDCTLADLVRGEWPEQAEALVEDADFEDLRLEGPLGRGGMGVVYRAVQISLDRPVAVKLLDPSQGWSAGQLERFQQEVLLAASVSHPNIAHVHWVRRQGRLFYFVMELIDGPSLAELMSSRSLALDDVVGIMSQVCAGLQHAHDRGVVHRDLKPGNILLERLGNGKGSGGIGRAVLVDFGLAARHGESSTTAAGQLMGTPAYMSPEQAAGRPTDHRSDLYSLGVTLFETLTGRVPFSAPTPMAMAIRHLAEPPPDPRTVLPALPDAFAELTNELLRKEPGGRPQSAAEVQERLREALASASRTGTARVLPSGMPGLALRDATALAVQLDGFVGAATDQPLTRTTFMLETWMTLVEAAMTRSEAAVVKQEGALLVAVFVASSDLPDDGERAIQALVDLSAAMRDFNRTHGRHQAFTAGLERGELFVGRLGPDSRAVAFGKAITTAESLSAVRHCGVGLVGPALIEHIGERVPLQPLIGVADELGAACRLEPAYLRGR